MMEITKELKETQGQEIPTEIIGLRRNILTEKMPVYTLAIPPYYKDKDFSNFKLEAGNKSAVESCLDFVKTLKKPAMLLGKVGTGKTHLIWATAKALVKEINLQNAQIKQSAEKHLTESMWQSPDFIKADFKVISFVEMLQKLKEGITTSTLPKILHQIQRVPYLFLDDLAAGMPIMAPQNWTIEMLYLIIDHRYRWNLSQMCASNLSLRELKSTLGEPIVSRLCEMCRVVVIDSRDWRLRQDV
jgi:DNA replication protein DnaC